LQRRAGTPAAIAGVQAFEPASAARIDDFAKFAQDIRSAETIGWSPEQPSQITIGSGRHTWPLSSIAFARHAAMNDQDTAPAGLRTLGSRARGRRTWGVLRGGVDAFSARLQKTLTIEEHLAMSEMFKRFFAGELGVLCAMPDYWRKVTILHANPGSFAVYGSWDALIGFARELQRVFQVFVEANLRDQAGAEGTADEVRKRGRRARFAVSTFLSCRPPRLSSMNSSMNSVPSVCSSTTQVLASVNRSSSSLSKTGDRSSPSISTRRFCSLSARHR